MPGICKGWVYLPYEILASWSVLIILGVEIIFASERTAGRRGSFGEVRPSF